MRGRKPKPKPDLAVIDGGARSSRPKPPTCPSHLSSTAKAEWKRLAAHLFARGIITEGDRAILAAYCQSYGRWVEAERKLAETPLLLKLPSGYIQQSPWLSVANKQLELMHKFAAELGLSPISRGRVTPRRPYRPKPWEAGATPEERRSWPASAYLKPR